MHSKILTVASQDFEYTLTNRIIWVVSLVVVLITVLPTARFIGVWHFEPQYLTVIPYNNRVYFVLLAGVIAYTAICGERETGTVRLVLGSSGTRRETVFGKLLARNAAALVILVPVLVLMELSIYLQQGQLYLHLYLPIALWTIVYTVSWVTFAVGISAAVTSRYRALGIIGATYLCFSTIVGVWSAVVYPLSSLLFTGKLSADAFDKLGSGDAPMWARYVEHLNPVAVYIDGGPWVEHVGAADQLTIVWPNVFGVFTFLLFGTLPLFVGYRRFNRADLGGGTTDSRLLGYFSTRLRGLLPSAGINTIQGRFHKRLTGEDTPRYITIAVADCLRLFKSRTIWAVAPVFLILSHILFRGQVEVDNTEIFFIPGICVFMLAGLLAYPAIGSERETGTLRLSLGLGGTRRDVLLGKIASRTVAVVVVLLPTLLVALSFNVLQAEGTPFHLYLFMSLSTVLYAVSWTWFAIGVSAAVTSRFRALITVGGTYLFFSPLTRVWSSTVEPLLGFLFTGEFASDHFFALGSPVLPTWVRYTGRLNPPTTYYVGQKWLVTVFGPPKQDVGLFPNLFGLLVLILLGTLPLIWGYRRFEKADLS